MTDAKKALQELISKNSAVLDLIKRFSLALVDVEQLPDVQELSAADQQLKAPQKRLKRTNSKDKAPDQMTLF